MLKFLDASKTQFGSINNFRHLDPLRSTHDGKLGGSHDSLVYIKNDDPTLYYVDVTLVPTSTSYDDIAGEFGETGFGLKLLYGERRPTETEWDQVKSGEPINLPDIGTFEAADTANYFPCWARLVVPGMTTAQIKKNVSIKVVYHTRLVGS